MFSLFVFFFCFFFFNDTATTEIYTLSLHDALPICTPRAWGQSPGVNPGRPGGPLDRKSTRLNSSHLGISYAVFCLKKKKKNKYAVLLKKKKKKKKTTTHKKEKE